MVRKITKLLHAKVRGLHEAAYLLALFAVLSQLLALIRDRLFAATFGAGDVLDTYYTAFKIPDFLFVSIASLVSIYVLIPFLTESIEKSKEKTQELLDSVFTVFAATLILVSGAIFVLAPQILAYVFPGFSEGSQFEELVLLTRILLLQPLFLGISNLIASIVQLKGRFVLYATSPLLYNIGIIFGVIVLYPLHGISGLAWGVVLGALMHLLLPFGFVAREGLLPKPTRSVDWKTILKVIRVSLPRTLTLAANQLTLLVLIAMATIFAAGSVSVFQFSLNLYSVPLTIIGVSYSVAAFPTLAKLFASGKKTEFVAQVASAARHVIFWSLPAIAFIVVLRAQLVRVILGAGEFDWADTRLTAAALALFAVALTAQALVLLLVRGYYAAGNTRKPLVINVLSSFLAVLSGYLLVEYFKANQAFQTWFEALLRVEGLPGTEVLLLPIGYAIGLLLNAFVLLLLFQRDYGSLWSKLSDVFWKTALASIVGAFMAHRMLALMVELVDNETLIGIFLQGFVAGILGLCVFVAVLLVLKSKELEESWNSLRHKFWKTKTVLPEGSEVE